MNDKELVRYALSTLVANLDEIAMEHIHGEDWTEKDTQHMADRLHGLIERIKNDDQCG